MFGSGIGNLFPGSKLFNSVFRPCPDISKVITEGVSVRLGVMGMFLGKCLSALVLVLWQKIYRFFFFGFGIRLEDIDLMLSGSLK